MTKFFQIIFLTFFLTSCGFTVIYKENDLSNYSYEQELAGIRIQKDRGRATQELRDALKDVLNPDMLKVEPKYILIVNMTRSISGTFITVTGASGRNKVTISINYTLLLAKTGKVIAAGSTYVNDNYDVQSNRYGTYVAEDYVASNLTKVVAQNIRNLLVNDIIEIKKKEENGEDIELKELPKTPEEIKKLEEEKNKSSVFDNKTQSAPNGSSLY